MRVRFRCVCYITASVLTHSYLRADAPGPATPQAYGGEPSGAIALKYRKIPGNLSIDPGTSYVRSLAAKDRIVEDDSAVLDSLRMLFEAMGYPAATFGSAVEFLRADMRDVECLILDHHMPDMTGLELAERLRADGVDMRILLIPPRRDRRYPLGPLRLTSRCSTSRSLTTTYSISLVLPDPEPGVDLRRYRGGTVRWRQFIEPGARHVRPSASGNSAIPTVIQR